PQLIKTWKTKSAKDLSLGMFVFFCFGVGLWLVYGIIINDIPILVSNAVTLVLSIMIVYFKLKYK
ncbi:MAG TPA: SemiSWEET transporter, partial [Ignavibacteriales bacterium]|nr:SemiSWEET transporter [Ignavibacteriales bacterium]